MSTVAYRAATPDDVEALARLVVEGVADYPSFAPDGWAPPSADHEAERLRELLADQRVWCLVAEAEGEPVGQVTVLPASISARPTDEPGLAHFANLFVRRDHWGTGVARRLTTAAVDEARERGLRAMRLFVAEGQARARRFYEREGWSAAGEPVLRAGARPVARRVPDRYAAASWWAIWMRLPQVSSSTAVVTGPIGVGGCTKRTPGLGEPVELGVDVVDRERRERDAVATSASLNGRTAGWRSGSRTSSTPSGSSADTTVSQRCSPSGTSCFFTKPSTSV